MKRLRTWCFCAGWLTATVTAAQTAKARPASQPQEGGLDPAAMLRLSRVMDGNGDLVVEEKELNDGLNRLQKEAEAARTNLLTWLDTNKDGLLSQEEMRPFHAAVQILQLIRGLDQNGDARLQENELDLAFARMAEFCQNANDRLTVQFDGDGDGRLSEAELQVARRAMSQVMTPATGSRHGPARNSAAPARRAARP